MFIQELQREQIQIKEDIQDVDSKMNSLDEEYQCLKEKISLQQSDREETDEDLKNLKVTLDTIKASIANNQGNVNEENTEDDEHWEVTRK